MISYGHAWCDDCGELYSASYVKTEDGQTLAAINVVDEDIYDIEATGSAGNHVGFYSYPDEGGGTSMSIATTTYGKIRYRYKVGVAQMRAKIVIVFSTWNPALSEADNLAAGNGQLILNDGVSLTWKSAAVALNAGKLIDHIRLYCNNAVGHVYFDFVLIYKGDFTLPNTKYGLSFKPPCRVAENEAPGASGDELQNLGSKSAIVDIGCDLDMGTWIVGSDTMPGQVFLDIAHNSATEDFQWIDLGPLVAQFKVLMREPEWQNVAGESEANSMLHLVFLEYRRSPANNETVVERFGLDL